MWFGQFDQQPSRIGAVSSDRELQTAKKQERVNHVIQNTVFLMDLEHFMCVEINPPNAGHSIFI